MNVTQMTIVKADNILKYRKLDTAVRNCNLLLKLGAEEIFDKQTFQEGGRKFRYKDEIYWLFYYSE